MKQKIVTEQIVIPVADSETKMAAYLARPDETRRHPVIIMGSEIFGVTRHIKDITERTARLGYIAIAPDFYHRTEPGVDLPYNDHGREKGLELLHLLRREEVLADVKAVMDFSASKYDTSPKAGFLGFSSGGHVGYLAATKLPLAATAVFYGGWITSTAIPLGRPEPTLTLTKGIAEQKGKLMFLVGDQDKLVSADDLDQIRQELVNEGVSHEIVVYPGVQHGFFCEARPDTFDEKARNDAWTTVQDFFYAALVAKTQ